MAKRKLQTYVLCIKAVNEIICITHKKLMYIYVYIYIYIHIYIYVYIYNYISAFVNCVKIFVNHIYNCKLYVDSFTACVWSHVLGAPTTQEECMINEALANKMSKASLILFTRHHAIILISI